MNKSLETMQVYMIKTGHENSQNLDIVLYIIGYCKNKKNTLQTSKFLLILHQKPLVRSIRLKYPFYQLKTIME